MESKRVKVISAEYDPKSDTVSWEIKFEDGHTADLLWLKDDFGPSFGFIGDMSTSSIEEFCKMMVGKEINHIEEPKL